MAFGGTPTPNIVAQKGGFLSDLFGKSYKGGNFWETPLGKGLMPAVSQMTGASPVLGGGILAAGMGPKDWQTLMGKSGPEAGRLGGFSRSTLDSFDKKNAAKPLAKYGEALYKLGQDLVSGNYALAGSPVEAPPTTPALKPRQVTSIPAAIPEANNPFDTSFFNQPTGTLHDNSVIDFSAENFPSPHVKIDEGMKKNLAKYLKNINPEGGWGRDYQGNPRWVQGGGLGWGAQATDYNHPLRNSFYTQMSDDMRQLGFGNKGGRGWVERGTLDPSNATRFLSNIIPAIRGKRDLLTGVEGSRKVTLEEFKQFMQGRRNESQARPSYDVKGNLQVGPQATDGFFGVRSVTGDEGPRIEGNPRFGTHTDRAVTTVPMSVPNLSDPSGRSYVNVGPGEMGKLKAEQMYGDYSKWWDAQNGYMGGFQGLTGGQAPRGTQAGVRPLEVFADDIPSQILNLLMMKKMTGRSIYPGETDTYAGSAYHQLMAGLQYGPDQFLERTPQGFGQRAAEFGVDLFSLAKNHGNYPLGSYIPGDPRYFMRKGIEAPIAAVKGAVPAAINTYNAAKNPLAAYASVMERARNARSAYLASDVKNIPAVLKAGLLRPFTAPLQGMGYGASGITSLEGLKGAERAAAKASNAAIGTITRNLNVLRAPKAVPSGAVSKLSRLSKVKSGLGVAGRVLGVLDGLRVLLQDPAEEALALWKAKSPQEVEAILRSRTQGKWSKNYRNHPGLIPVDAESGVDYDGDGKFDVDAEGNKIMNPWAGKRSIPLPDFLGGGGGKNRIPVSEGVSKFLGKAMMGIEQPHYAAQELGASILDIPALWGGQGGGKWLSDENRAMRFGIDLDGKPLGDYYTEGTHENLSASLPQVENGIRQFENQIVTQDDPATAADETRFAPLGDEEITQGMGREQLISFMADNYYSEYGNPEAVATGVVNNMQNADQQKYIDEISQSVMPDGRARVSDQAVLQHQVRGWLLSVHGDSTEHGAVDSNGNSLHGNVALKDLPNDKVVNPETGAPRWEDEAGNPMGLRDFTLDNLRKSHNDAIKQEVVAEYHRIMAESEKVLTPGGATGMSPSQASDMALNTAAGKAPTLEHRIVENPEWSKSHPELSYQSVRDELQSQVTVKSPYRSEVIGQKMRDRHQQEQGRSLQELRDRRDELAGTEGITGRVEATRDVTKGLKWENPATMKRVASQQAKAEEHNSLINRQLSQTQQGSGVSEEAKLELLRQYRHNEGIIQQAKKIQSVYDAEAKNNWRGEGDMVEVLRKNMAAVGGAVRDYEKYNPKDINEQIRGLINMNKGRRDLFDTLRKLQDAYETTPAYDTYQKADRARRGWDAVDKNMR
jgi:hypothetical protein